MASQATRFSKSLAKTRNAVVKQLEFSDKGRKRTTRSDRIDLTRMTTNEAMELITGIEPAATAEAIKQVGAKKAKDKLKKMNEMGLNSKVIDVNNIYETGSTGIDVSCDTPESDGSVANDQDGTPNQCTGLEQPKTASAGLEQPKTASTEFKQQGSLSKLGNKETCFGLFSNKLTNVGFPTSPKITETGTQQTIINNDDDLEETLPMSKTSETQTEDLFMGSCSCTKCVAIFNSFQLLVDDNQLGCKDKTVHQQRPKLNTSATSFVSREGSELEKGDEKMVPLVKGCPAVLIPLSKKAAVETECPDGDPRTLIHYILNCLYDTVELAQMTFSGKTKGVKQLPSNVSAILQVYVKAKMNTLKYNFDKTILKECCNERFYAARRWVWNNRPDLVGTVVRAKMTKNTKKEGQPVKKKNATKKKKSKYEKKSQDIKKSSDKSRAKGRGKDLKEQDKRSKAKHEVNERKDDREKRKSKGQDGKKVAREKNEGRATTDREKTNNVPESKGNKKITEREKEGRPSTGNKRPKPMSEEVFAKVGKFTTSTPHHSRKSNVDGDSYISEGVIDQLSDVEEISDGSSSGDSDDNSNSSGTSDNDEDDYDNSENGSDED